MHKLDGYGRNTNIILAHVLGAALIGVSIWAATRRRRSRKMSEQLSSQPENLVPKFASNGSSHNRKLEKFSDYVARQLGFKELGKEECPQMCKLADEYLKDSKGSENAIYEYFASHDQANGESLYLKLLEEFDRCILGYLAFHWTQASLLITQVLSVGSDQKKLKDVVMAATRKQRFEKVTKDLRVTRAFSMLVEEMKVIGCGTPRRCGAESDPCTDVMVPVVHSERSPVLLFMGGGMGAGKSTVLKDILKESFWSEAAANAVVVEADAFKETDVIYRALSTMGHHHDMLQTAELVHQTSADAASSLLVTALNEGRDVIMDGTLSWEPFVNQTIAMARNVHKHRYRMGLGYKVSEDGTTTENYWEQVEESNGEDIQARMKPYRIELVGVVCDPFLAVVRGIRRAIAIKRAVRVKSQLTSHKRFANAFPQYCQLVDNARLYCTNGVGVPPSLIGWKDGDKKLLIDPEQIKCLTIVANLNEAAESVYELYADEFEPGSVWNDLVCSPARPGLQVELRNAIRKIETPNLSTI